MVIEAVTSSVITAKIRKGKLRNIENVELRGWYLFIAGFVLEVSANLLKASSWQGVSGFLDRYFSYIHVLAYILLFVAIAMNFRKRSMVFIFAGTFMNFLVILLNGGHMPIWFEGLKIVGLVEPEATQATLDLSHSLITGTTKLKFLADIIPLPKPYPLPKILSIGDLVLAVGVFLFIQEAMLPKETNIK